MNASDLLSLLDGRFSSASALRAITRLGPAGGPGDKIFPPTYSTDKPGVSRYAVEDRYLDGKPVKVVLIDSVQSQANRIEQALLEVVDAGEVDLPLLAVQVGGHGRVTTLEAPHRIYDAIFRDSMLEGVRFRETELGRRVVEARFHNATALYETCPTMLLFGGWDSHAGNVERSAKLQRAMTSEIVGFDAISGVRTKGRIDPCGIKVGAGPVYRHRNSEEHWTLDPGQAETEGKGKTPRTYGKKGNPSEIGHSNIAPTITDEGGFTISEARQMAVLSFPQLRRLRFPDPATGEVLPGRDHACRLVLAALALYGLCLQAERGYDLRSRCLLIPLEAPSFELLGRTVNDVERLDIDVVTAREALAMTLEWAEAQGARWRSGTTWLTAQPKLDELVRLSALAATPDEA